MIWRSNRLAGPDINCTMEKKEITPEQARVMKALRLMVKIALRIIGDEKKKARPPDM